MNTTEIAKASETALRSFMRPLPPVVLEFTHEVPSLSGGVAEQFYVLDLDANRQGIIQLCQSTYLQSNEDFLFVDLAKRITSGSSSKGAMLAGYLSAAALAESRNMRLSAGLSTTESALKIWNILAAANVAFVVEEPQIVLNIRGYEKSYATDIRMKRLAEL